MKVLVLGGGGMLGHQLVRELSQSHEVCCTVRTQRAETALDGLGQAETVYGVDVRRFESVVRVMDDFEPGIVVNGVGMVSQRPDAAKAALTIELNALLPHRLYDLCASRGARLIHFSTDCVFSGKTGMYADSALHDAQDLYGKSKSLGEVAGPGAVTLRTSIIGPELSNKLGLLEWFLAQKGRIRGYRKAVFSGLTTMEMSRIVDRVISRYPKASGVFNVSADPIDKYSLLCLLRDALGLQTEIVPDDEVCHDKSLDSSLFREQFDYHPPSWEQMVEELVRYLKVLGE